MDAFKLRGKQMLQIGDTVFFYYANNEHNIYEGKVEEFPDHIHNVKVRVIHKIDDKGRVKPPTQSVALLGEENPTWHPNIKQLYVSLEDAHDSITKCHNKKIREYKTQIKTIEDLLIFPLKNDMTDPDIATAYKQRSKSLLHIDIDKLLTPNKSTVKRRKSK